MKFVIIILCFSTIWIGCDKEEAPSCYDASLIHNGVCTKDCPGFIGCDGREYCNECEAARLGIGPR